MMYHGMDEMILKIHLLRPIRFLAVLSPNYWLRKPTQSRGVRLRKTLEDLGPIYIKFGQALSTRKDMLPDDITDELVKLQDKTSFFSGKLARQVIEQQLGKKISATFAEFEPIPLASASIAQVHGAKLYSGEEVVVKVLRPHIEKRIAVDLDLLYELARLAEKFWDNARRLRVTEVVAEFEKTLNNELDLIKEATNATRLRSNFQDSNLLYIPKIHWQFARQKVLVIERIHGIPVGETKRLKQHNVDFKLLAERGVAIFFTQVFRDNFFHADMHPGNIFVDLPAKYIAIDFGIMGTLSLSDQHYLAENFLAFFNRDYRRVAEMHIESGWVCADTCVEDFEVAIRSVCEPIFDKPLKDISFGLLLLRLFQTARRFDMVVQPQLVLLQKTLLNIEGLGRQLYPALDLWQTAKPFLNDWVKQRIGPKAKIKQVIKQFPYIAEHFPQMPTLIFQALDGVSQTKRQLEKQNKEIVLLRQQIEKNHDSTFWLVLASTLLISASVFFQ